MYNFHKVKDEQNSQKFCHTLFKQDCYEDLGFIRRKKVTLTNNPNNKSFDSMKDKRNDNLQDELKQLEKQFNSILNQNKSLTELNKTMMNKLHDEKTNYNICIKKLLFMLTVLHKNEDPTLSNKIKQNLLYSLVGIGTCNMSSEEEVSNLIQRLNTIPLSNESDMVSFVNPLLKIVLNYISQKSKVNHFITKDSQSCDDNFGQVIEYEPEFAEDKPRSVSQRSLSSNVNNSLSFGSVFNNSRIFSEDKRQSMGFETSSQNPITFDGNSSFHFNSSHLDSQSELGSLKDSDNNNFGRILNNNKYGLNWSGK